MSSSVLTTGRQASTRPSRFTGQWITDILCDGVREHAGRPEPCAELGLFPRGQSFSTSHRVAALLRFGISKSCKIDFIIFPSCSHACISPFKGRGGFGPFAAASISRSGLCSSYRVASSFCLGGVRLLSWEQMIAGKRRSDFSVRRRSNSEIA